MNGELLSESDGTSQTDYIYLNGQPLAVLKGSNIYYIHNDHLGTPRAITDSTKTVVWHWDSDAFGATPANDDVDNNGTVFTFNLRFPGQYYDAETGLHYNYFRYYDPSTGRYITSDPIGLAGGLNTYGYVGGNPLTRIDPTGEVWFLAPFFAGGGSAAAGGTAGGVGFWSTLFGGASLFAIATVPGDTQNQNASIHDEATKAGQEASDELDEGGQCPVAEDNGHGPKCQEIGR